MDPLDKLRQFSESVAATLRIEVVDQRQVDRFLKQEAKKQQLTQKDFISKLEQTKANATEEASDAIDYFNKQTMKPSQLKNIKPIPGSFNKVRANGGASRKDIGEH